MLSWEIDGEHVKLSAFENDTNQVEVRRNAETDSATVQVGVTVSRLVGLLID